MANNNYNHNIPWFCIDINSDMYDMERIKPYKLNTILKVPESYINGDNINIIRSLIIDQKVQPYNGVLVFQHKGMYLGLCENYEKLQNFKQYTLKNYE